ncbi:MAG: peptidase M14 [Candidatus Latescibacteria bacterium]|nr:peptidase M14 [Candidatus Latescibacterota bacterium]
MRVKNSMYRYVLRFFCIVLSFFITSISTAQQITPPDDFFGHRVGADYKLVRWEKMVEYFYHVSENSDRVNTREIGTTTEGRPFIIAEISSPETIRDMDKHKKNQQKIADPRLIDNSDEEQRLIAEAKVVVLVNCSLHATEIAATQMSLELLYDLATGNSDEIENILEQDIVILVPSANPDGHEIVIDWYERSLGKPWEGSGMPWIYHPYAGHDNNRDWFMLNLKETRAETDLIYNDWLPNIVYDVHQMGSLGARFFVPPFFDPKNPNIHPLTDHMLMIIGGHMAAELTRNEKKGILNSAMYDNWWQGGFRTTVYRHNMVGILTEAASATIASPIFQRKSQLRGESRGMPDYSMTTNFPDPWPGGWWRLRDIVEYDKTACMSLFTLAARYHDLFQSNALKLAHESIERGKTEPPFAWLVPPGQHDPRSARDMLEILHATAIEVHQAEESFVADGVTYPEGTYIMYCAQPYRSHLNDMMERQIYPNRSQYPGGPPEAPYDTAGWTLPLQMGVRSIAVSGQFDCKARKLDSIPLPKGSVQGNVSGYLLKAASNDDYRLINRMHNAGIRFSLVNSEEQWGKLTKTVAPTGSIYIRDGENFRNVSTKLLEGITSQVTAVEQSYSKLSPALTEAKTPRHGLYQPWTASMDEGWTRLVLENFEFPYVTVHNAEIRAGNLNERHDCLILPSVGASTIINGQAPDATEPQYVGGIDSDGIVALQNFVQSGGTLVCIDQSCNLPIEHFNIPVRNILSGKKADEFFCPGSILRVWIDTDHPLGYGMTDWASAYFSRSQAFEIIEPEKNDKKDTRSPEKRYPATVVARYSDTVLLESGWIRGGDIIADKPAIVEVSYGKGKIVLFGFGVQHRGQPHGTFRLLFNAIQRSALK